MLHTLGVVDVHTLAGHPLAARRLGSHTLLEWVVRRVSESQLLEGVLVLMDDDPEHHRVGRLLPPSVHLAAPAREDSLEEMQADPNRATQAAPNRASQGARNRASQNVPQRGLGRPRPGQDPLSRLVAAAREHGAEAIVRVDIAFPFVDPVFLDRLVTTASGAKACDYISYCRGISRGTLRAQLGVFGEWCRLSALERADREARHEVDRRDPLQFVRSHPERFGMRLIPVPAALDREDMRLTIDGEDDWHRTEMIFDALGAEALDWQQLTGLMDRQPELRQQMAALNRERG